MLRATSSKNVRWLLPGGTATAATIFLFLQWLLIFVLRDRASIVWVELPILAVLVWMAIRQYIAAELPLCVASACAFHLAEPSVGFGPIIYVALIPMLEVIRRQQRNRVLFTWGLLSGVYIATGIYAWVWPALVTFFEMGQITALPMFLLLCIMIGAQFAIFLPVARWVMNRSGMPFWICAAILYTAIEYWMPLPLPVALGLAFANQPVLLQPADVGGLHFVSLFVALVNCATWQVWRSWRSQERSSIAQPLFVGVLTLLLHCGYGWWAKHYYRPDANAPSVDIAMIQPVSPLKVMNRDTAQQEQSAAVLRDLSLQACGTGGRKPDLLLWPEGAGAFASRTPGFNPAYMRSIRDVQVVTSVTLLVQDVEFVRAEDGKLRYYSTVSRIEPGELSVSSYRKNVLMPFGEYLPFEAQLPFLRRWLPEARSVLAGKETASMQTATGRIAPSICFEILFPRYTAKVAYGGVGYIVNLTNDRWYGVRQQPRQHLAFAQLRAIENRKPVARATNSGISALIDARGYIPPKHKTLTMQRTWLRGSIYPQTGHTFYAFGGHFACPFLLTCLALLSLRKGRKT